MWSIKRIDKTEEGQDIYVCNINSACCHGKEYKYLQQKDGSIMELEHMDTVTYAVKINIEDALNEYNKKRSS